MSKYFTPNEMVCNCGCNMDVSDELKELLERARSIADTPFVITSGARCQAYNTSIGSKSTSSHTTGLAVDIGTKNSRDRSKVLQALCKVGFTRLGIAKTFIHCDIAYDKAQDVVWIYN